VKVHRLTSDNSALAVATIQLIKPATTTAEHVTNFLARSDHYFIAAIEADEPIGFALAFELQRIDRAQPMLFLYEIAVADACQRQGLASAMIGFLKSICHEKGLFKMFVIASASNIAAIRLYESTFDETRRHDVVYSMPTAS
jgi:ribosomal protein S18 acetylase RimI-like enzyme